MIPYFKSIKLEPARMAALFFSLLALAAKFGLHLSDPQLDAIKDVVSILVTMFGAAELSRSKTLSKPAAEAVTTEALLTDPPASVDAAKSQAKDLVAAPPAPKVVVSPIVVGLLAFLLASCASPRDAAVATLNASADFARVAEPALEALDRTAQQDALEAAKSHDAAVTSVAAARARYHVAWSTYRAYRTAWLAAAAEVRVYDDATRAKLAPSATRYVAAMSALVAAEGELAVALTAAREGGAK